MTGYRHGEAVLAPDAPQGKGLGNGGGSPSPRERTSDQPDEAQDEAYDHDQADDIDDGVH
jgi:hypothetical protein